jgi:hypothetical protein
MSTWTEEELRAVAAVTELRISTRRRDGALAPPVPISAVRVGDGITCARTGEPAEPGSGA